MAIDKQRGIRLETFINSLNIKHKLFAQRVGTSNKFVSQIINGHSNLTTDMAYRIGKAYPKLNKDWLLYGTGGMEIVQIALPNKLSEPDVLYSSDPLNGLRAILEKHEQRIVALEEAMAHKDDLLRNLMDRMGRLLQEGGGADLE